MNAKKITTVLLMLFVITTIGTIVAKETGPRSVVEKAIVITSPIVDSQIAPQAVRGPVSQSEAPKQPETTAPAKVVAYYFHGNYRCSTCRKIEALTTEAIQTGFANDVKNGRVELKVINVEDPGNEHYVQDYQLAARSVVVARYEAESQKDWKRLDAVWQLTNDKDAFIRLVQNETATLLKGKN